MRLMARSTDALTKGVTSAGQRSKMSSMDWRHSLVARHRRAGVLNDGRHELGETAAKSTWTSAGKDADKLNGSFAGIDRGFAGKIGTELYES